MSDVVTDTHALIWWLEDDARLSTEARKWFELCERGEGSVFVPVICLVEMVYLQEKGRIPADLKARFDAVLQAGRSSLILVDLTGAVVEALTQVPYTEVPDMPDRIIAATALLLGLPLISRDRKIKMSAITSIW